MKLKFTKMQAYGNDYVYIDAVNQDLSGVDLSLLSQKLTDRHFYIGSDGIVLICPSDKGDFRMRMFNPDGSEGEMCGNALRSVGKFVYDHRMTDKQELVIETLGGMQHLNLFVEDDLVVNILADIGEPGLNAKLVPAVTEHDRFYMESVEILDKTFQISALSWGNPHCVIFVEDVANFDVHRYGRAIEHHLERFPKRTNVTFAQVIRPDYIKMREWERGTGETIGCGTGCCTAAVFGVISGQTQRQVTVEQIGGNLEVMWDVDTNRVRMKGPSHTVFESEIEVDA